MYSVSILKSFLQISPIMHGHRQNFASCMQRSVPFVVQVKRKKACKFASVEIARMEAEALHTLCSLSRNRRKG